MKVRCRRGSDGQLPEATGGRAQPSPQRAGGATGTDSDAAAKAEAKRFNYWRRREQLWRLCSSIYKIHLQYRREQV